MLRLFSSIDFDTEKLYLMQTAFKLVVSCPLVIGYQRDMDCFVNKGFPLLVGTEFCLKVSPNECATLKYLYICGSATMAKR